MFSYKRTLGVVAGAATLVVMAAPSFASLDKCSKLIDGEGQKMQSSTAKGFAKCNDAYRKDVIKPPTPALSKAAAACEKELSKILGAGGVLDKSITKLASQVPKTCTDSDLIALGHLNTATFGNRWAQFQGMASLAGAYDQQLNNTGDWVNNLIKLAKTGSCASCAKLQIPPCNLGNCILAGSSATVKLANFSVPVDLAGVNNLQVCDPSTLISSATGVLFVIGGPGKSISPAQVGPIATACVRPLRAEGLIQCGSGAQKVDYATCIDHNAGTPNESGSPTSGGCTGDVCAESQKDSEAPQNDPDEADDHENGGGCIDYTAGSGPAGSAYVNLSTQIGLAPPGDLCNDTSTLRSAGTPSNNPLTTGSASSKVLNADGIDGSTIESDPVTGAPYTCSLLPSGKTGPVNLVGAFGSINTLQAIPGSDALLDSVTIFELKCQ